MAQVIEFVPVPGSAPTDPLGAALRWAADFEEWAGNRYYGLADSMDSQARPVLLALATDARSHAEQLRDMVCGATGLQQLRQAFAARPCAELLHCGNHLPTPSVDPSEDEALLFAEACEHFAHDYYRCLARLTPAGPLRDLVSRLRDEKRRHEKEVQSCHAALFLIW